MSLESIPTRERLYEIAYLCCRANRVALVALVALWQDGQIRILFKRQRVYCFGAEPRHPIEAVALDAIPRTGLPLQSALINIAAAPAMAQIADSVRGDGLSPRRWRFGSRQSRRARRQLLANPGDGLRRVAVLGTTGIEDERLRQAFDIPIPKLVYLKWRGRGPYGTADSTDFFWQMVRFGRVLERDMRHHADGTAHGFGQGATDHGGGGWDSGGWSGGSGDGGGY